MTEQTDDQQVEQMSCDEIIAAFGAPYTGRLPVQAIRAAQQRREEMIPALIGLVRNATEAARNGIPVEGEGHFFALFLLAEFRAKQALPTILETIRLAEEPLDELYGDATTECLAAILSSLVDDSAEVLDELIADESVYEFVRWNAADAFLYLVKAGRISREQAVERLRVQLARAIAKRDSTAVGFLVCELEPYSPREAAAEIDAAYKAGLVAATLLRREYIDESLEEGEAWFQKSLQNPRLTGVVDTVETLQSWHAYSEASARQYDAEYDADLLEDDDFDDVSEDDLEDGFHDEPSEDSPTIRHETPRVGRNDLCPCGSGKKFKKCCARK